MEHYKYGVALDKFFFSQVVDDSGVTLTKKEKKMVDEVMESYEIKDKEEGRTITYKLKDKELFAKNMNLIR